jgi:hypothetical protein
MHSLVRVLRLATFDDDHRVHKRYAIFRVLGVGRSQCLFMALSQHRIGNAEVCFDPKRALSSVGQRARIVHPWLKRSDKKLRRTVIEARKPSAVICLAVQISAQKYFASRFGRSRLIDSSYPVPGNEGRTRRHERWVRDAMDASAACDERGRGGRRSRVVLMPRRWHQLATILRIARGRWQESPITGESTEKIVKTIAQGRPGIAADLW